MMEWPEFVTEEEESARRAIAAGELTGWETVVFQVEDDQDSPSPFSTAALAP